jgi:predicted neutral ceramidase superfamily lipid hydrolase
MFLVNCETILDSGTNSLLVTALMKKYDNSALIEFFSPYFYIFEYIFNVLAQSVCPSDGVSHTCYVCTKSLFFHGIALSRTILIDPNPVTSLIHVP